MKKKSVVAKILCGAFALIMAASATACSSTNDHPLVPADGYELSYNKNKEYYKLERNLEEAASVYMTTNDFGLVNGDSMKVDIADLVPVRPKDKNDISTGYYDKEKRLVIYNLYIWTANGETNYKMGTKACDDINSDDIWEVDETSNTTTSASTTTASTTAD